MRAGAARRLFYSAVLTLAMAVGCGGGGDDDDGVDGSNGGGAGSCTVSAASTCVDYTGSMWTATSAEENCKELPGSTYSDAVCPTADRMGSCVRNQDAPGEHYTYYYAPTFTAATAESACLSSGGTWVP